MDETSLLKEWLAGGVANSIASAILHPIDIAKTKMQVSKHTMTLRRSCYDLYIQSGSFIGCYRPALHASILREMLSSGIRAGFYVHVRDYLCLNMFTNADKNSLAPKVLASFVTGAMGSFIANPLDLIKIRLMADVKKYNNSIYATFKAVVSEEGGLFSLYKGILPSTCRAMAISAGELATYDFTKNLIKRITGEKESTKLHVITSMITGFVAAAVAAPFDMVKSRAMNDSKEKVSVRIFVNVIKNEGFGALYRGFVPSWCRLTPHAIICFPIFEFIRNDLLNIGYL